MCEYENVKISRVIATFINT